MNVDNEAKFWDAIRALTYEEMLNVAGQIRDTWEADGDRKAGSAEAFADVLHWSRMAYDVQEAEHD